MKLEIFMMGEKMKNRVSIIGLGYVGLANALLLAQKEQVKAYDIISEKVEMLRRTCLL